MPKNKTILRRASVRKAYHRPVLIKLGSVQGLTLKLGSISDGLGTHE